MFLDLGVSDAQIEADEQYTIEFKNFAIEHSLPHGSRTKTRRKLATASNDDAPQKLLVDELGVDLAQEIIEHIVKVNYDLLPNEPTHPLHDLYVLTRIGHYMSLKLRIKWLKEFYLPPTRLLFEHERFFEEKPKDFFSFKRSPLMTRLGGRYYVHDDKRLYLCNDAHQLVLTWLYLLSVKHRSLTQKLTDCSEFVKKFDVKLFD